MNLKIGDVIELKELSGQKCIITRIVEGGFGMVYFLKTTALPFMPNVVMKILKNNKNINDFFREAVLWSKIGHHKNIASYICFGKYCNKFYILSNRYDKTLGEIDSTKLDENSFRKILIGIINALNYANNKLGLVHRDIKPNNIFIDKNFTVKIGDFGLSSYHTEKIILDENFTKVDFHNTISQLGFGGTIPYMSPELFSRHFNFNIQSDIYAVGVSLFEVATSGRFPYLLPQFSLDNNSIKIFTNNYACKEIRNIILRCIDLDTKKRYKNYEEILDELSLNNEENYIPSLNDYIFNIQTLRRTGQIQNAKKIIVQLLNEYKKNPMLINQLAIITKEEKGILESIKIYENLFSQELTYDIDDYFELMFNLIGFYFETKQFKKIVPFMNRYDGYLSTFAFLSNEYIEYSIYFGFKKEYEKSYNSLLAYCTNHSFNDLHALFILILANKINKIDGAINLLEIKKSDFTKELIKLYKENTIDNYKNIIYNIENEVFGGV
jgi:serine/threonine protein kinase